MLALWRLCSQVGITSKSLSLLADNFRRPIPLYSDCGGTGDLSLLLDDLRHDESDDVMVADGRRALIML